MDSFSHPFKRQTFLSIAVERQALYQHSHQSQYASFSVMEYLPPWSLLFCSFSAAVQTTFLAVYGNPTPIKNSTRTPKMANDQITHWKPPLAHAIHSPKTGPKPTAIPCVGPKTETLSAGGQTSATTLNVMARTAEAPKFSSALNTNKPA